ncbi:hypothetical protein QVD17_10641 [Tagetes erecta]|uniref:Alpha-ketoglutarate-dependent dioxygenase AlkB-like domain-containing protein n=1 Tax=Tagetes erecta TaxID=13708 RepID=A0AAD8P6H2_TARER|nr:hypothetical protein QVD17_10641 [Tagetes erecta]
MKYLDQVDIVNICEKWGVQPGGFKRINYDDEVDCRTHMCFGRNWDPKTKYNKRYRNDGSEPPPIPYELVSLAETAIRDAQAHMDELPSMCPDTCLVSFYPSSGYLGIHQDCDESFESLERGLPVVSIFLGESVEFLYGYTRDHLDCVILLSGDVLIFGGKSRAIYHGVRELFCDTKCGPLLDVTALRLGGLNVTLKQF